MAGSELLSVSMVFKKTIPTLAKNKKVFVFFLVIPHNLCLVLIMLLFIFLFFTGNIYISVDESTALYWNRLDPYSEAGPDPGKLNADPSGYGSATLPNKVMQERKQLLP